MSKLSFYILPDDYIEYMSKFDNKICYNKRQKRPYIGIIFKVKDINYFAPFASPKPKHLRMKQAIDYVKIDNGRLGVINLNNMIPVPLNICKRVELANESNEKYKSLMQKQYLWCNKEENYNKILDKARVLYYLIVKKECGQELIDRCCNYKLLEEKYVYYKKGHVAVDFM